MSSLCEARCQDKRTKLVAPSLTSWAGGIFNIGHEWVGARDVPGTPGTEERPRAAYEPVVDYGEIEPLRDVLDGSEDEVHDGLGRVVASVGHGF